MRKKPQNRKNGHLLEITTGIATALMCAAPVVMAQGGEQAEESGASESGEELDTVVVRGTREAQRTSIERKKTARTAVDSIAAEDVGKFPDQNVNEAISRIAG